METIRAEIQNRVRRAVWIAALSVFFLCAAPLPARAGVVWRRPQREPVRVSREREEYRTVTAAGVTYEYTDDLGNRVVTVYSPAGIASRRERPAQAPGTT